MGNINIPGRMTSIAEDRVICGADEVLDDALGSRQSELNARFKAITDQEQIALNGGEAEIANTGADIIKGSGAIPTSNAVAERLNSIESVVLMGTIRVVGMNGDLTVREISVNNNTQVDVLYNNNTTTELTLTILNTNFKTPDGNDIVLTVPVGGYSEVSYLRIEDVIYVRGC